MVIGYLDGSDIVKYIGNGKTGDILMELVFSDVVGE